MRPVQLMCSALIGLLPFTTIADGVWKDGPFIGYSQGGDVETDQPAFGWNVAHEFNDTLSIESALTGQFDELTPAFLTAPIDQPMDLTVVSATIGGRAGWFVNPVAFHIGGGLGYYYFNADDERIRVAVAENEDALPPGTASRQLTNSIDGALGVYAGVGAEWLLSPRWEVFLDYRRVWVNTDAHYEVRDVTSGTSGTTTTYDESLEYNHNLFRLGVQYRF